MKRISAGQTLVSDARLKETLFINTNLRGVKGLDSCEHEGPSSIDFETLALSGELPLAFLQSVGLPEHFIDSLLATAGDPLQFYKCFISYSTKDQAFAEQLHADLQSNGVRCWFAPQDVQAGKKLHEQINEAIRVVLTSCFSS
ncbi:MAG: toll/interleukin-1 receptor domain-containing protein [Dehalococcoidia bacterium]